MKDSEVEIRGPNANVEGNVAMDDSGREGYNVYEKSARRETVLWLSRAIVPRLDCQWRYLALIVLLTFLDPPRPDTKQTIKDTIAYGSNLLGAVSCLSSLLLLYFLLDSWNPDGFFQQVGMQGIQYGQITTAIYLKVSVSDFLALFSARTGRKFFWQVLPAGVLLGGGCIALAISSVVSLVLPSTELDKIEMEGLMNVPGVFAFVWIFSLIFWFVQDLSKVLLFKWTLKTNFRGISTSGIDLWSAIVMAPTEALDMIMDPNTLEREEEESLRKEVKQKKAVAQYSTAMICLFGFQPSQARPVHYGGAVSGTVGNRRQEQAVISVIL